ncbi:MAG: peroxiredoxin [Solirubrobacteraceae bacterium]
MALTIGDTAPDFEAETTAGRIRFHEWLGDSWGILFSHPRDFTPICTTELGYMALINGDFEKRGAKPIAISVDPIDNHEKWFDDIGEYAGARPTFPLIGDTNFEVAKAYGMLPADTAGDPTERTPAQNATLRNVFIVDPSKKIRLVFVYPMTIGRNFDEILRALDALQLSDAHRIATPAQWKQGEDVVLTGAISDDEAKQLYPEGWKQPLPYIRIVPSPEAPAAK